MPNAAVLVLSAITPVAMTGQRAMSQIKHCGAAKVRLQNLSAKAHAVVAEGAPILLIGLTNSGLMRATWLLPGLAIAG